MSRARSFREVRKSKPKREPYDVILIVCEGAKTEPDYFRSLIREIRLSSANVEVVGEECGSSPATLVDYGLKRLERSDGYDRIFCVFDRDIHPNFQAAIDRCHSLKRRHAGKQVKFEAITSTPCFEYWLILHRVDSFKPYAATGNKSVGDEAVKDLRRVLGKYKKGGGGVYETLRDGLDNAIRRAKQGRAQGLENPRTEVDKLVEYLRGVRNF